MEMRVWAGVVLLLAAGGCWAQHPSDAVSSQSAYVPSLTFDVASVRESPPANSFTLSVLDPWHTSALTITNFNLGDLLAEAYGLNQEQITGLPAWALQKRFNIQAKSESAIDDRLKKLSDKQAWMEKRHMMQALLAERFQMKVHWETRKSVVYDLVVGKNGSKLHPGGSVPLTDEEKKDFDLPKIPQLHQRTGSQRGYEWVGHSCPLASLAEILTGMMGLPVIDKTGFKDKYDFVLQYNDSIQDDADEDPNFWPPVAEAVSDQLGLKLLPAKGERQFLVIDHIEQLSAN